MNKNYNITILNW